MHQVDIINEINRLVAAGLRNSAIDIIQERLEQTPNDAAILRVLGRIYLLEQKPEQAVKYLQRSLEIIKGQGLEQSDTYKFDSINHEDLDLIAHTANVNAANYVYDSELSIVAATNSSAKHSSYNNGAEKSDTQLFEPTTFSNLQTATNDLNIDNPPDDFCFYEDDIPAIDFDEELVTDDSEDPFIILDLEETPTEREFGWDDVDDFDEIDDPDLDHPQEIPITTQGKLSRWDRAGQIAAEVIQAYDWGKENLTLLQQVFYENGWAATRFALETELAKGLRPAELALARFVRSLWTENEQYWISTLHITSRLSGQLTRAAYKVMSWPESLRIIRTFNSLPSEEEIQYFIDEVYDDWYGSPKRQKNFKVFIRYLKYRTGSVGRSLPGNELFSFTEFHDHEAFLDSSLAYVLKTPIIHELKNELVDIEQILLATEQKYSVIRFDYDYGVAEIYGDFQYI